MWVLGLYLIALGKNYHTNLIDADDYFRILARDDAQFWQEEAGLIPRRKW